MQVYRTRIGSLFFSLLFALFLLPSVGLAANFYVRAGATGSNNGSDWSNAWSSMSGINYNVINPGDTIYIAGGTYGPLAILKSGTAGNPITFRRATASAHGTDVGWSSGYDARVIIDGNNSLAGIGIGEGGSWSGQSYITIDGATRYGIWVKNAYYGIRAGRDPGNNGLTFRHLELGDAGTGRLDEDGIQGKGNDLLVENCYIHDNDSAITHGDGIQWFGGDRITLRYNVWKNNGQQIYIGEGAWNMVGRDVNIYYNVIHNRGGGHYNGIVLNSNSTQAGHFINVYNNTFDLEALDNSGFNSLFYPKESPATINFKNNAVIASNAGSMEWMTVNASNGYDNSGTGFVYNIPSTETGKVTAADLGFVNQSGFDYHLTASSPLIGRGVNVGLTRDFDGKPVPANPSIGAFEYGSGTPTTPTPTPTPAPSPTPSATPTPTPSATPAPAISLFTSQIPVLKNSTDGVSYELGMKFRSTRAGRITAIRYYKAPSDTGTHAGTIWSSSGAILARVTFSGETSSGWQTQKLATPLRINAYTTYTVSTSINRYYADTVGGLSTAVRNGPLSSVADGRNGVYGPVGRMPTQSWNNSNYFRDIVFVAE